MQSAARRLLPASLRTYGKAVARNVRMWRERIDYALDRRTLSRDELVCQLMKLGITTGSTVYLHSSMDEFTRRVPEQSPLQFVSLLKELVGEAGTILMPTFPFRGPQYGYVKSQREFDVARTPSQVGLLTEMFRRMEGVTRSLHPTHSVAAWGKYSKELVAEHHLGTAFGEKSPVFKMQQYHGLIAGVGVVPHQCFTLFHVAEELHPSSRAMQYGTDTFDMTLINGTEKLPYEVIPLRPDRLRRYDQADRILRREGILRFYSFRGLKLSVTPVSQFLRRAQELIEAGKFYSGASQTLLPRAMDRGDAYQGPINQIP